MEDGSRTPGNPCSSGLGFGVNEAAGSSNVLLFPCLRKGQNLAAEQGRGCARGSKLNGTRIILCKLDLCSRFSSAESHREQESEGRKREREKPIKMYGWRHVSLPRA